MSSRHSSFSLSSPPKSWRSPSKPSPADISLVFAEPVNITIPSGAAALTLPKHQLKPDEDSLSIRSGRVPSAHRRASQSSLRSTASRISRHQNGSEVPHDTQPSPREEALETLPVDGPSVEQPGTFPGQPRPSRWFSSLRKTTPKKPTIAATEASYSSPTSTSPDPPSGLSISDQQDIPIQPPSTGNISVPTEGGLPSERGSLPVPPVVSMPLSFPLTAESDKGTSASPPGDVSSKRHLKSWFSSSSAVNILALTSQSEPSENPNSVNANTICAPGDIVGSPSSLDQHVNACEIDSIAESTDNSLPSSTPQNTKPSLPTEPRERKRSNLSSLNPSTPRFVLSMPLLGRPKVPLGQVIGVVTSTQSDQTPIVDQRCQPDEGGESHGGEKSVIENIVTVESSTSKAAESNPSSSWWSYLGYATIPPTSSQSPTDSSPSTPTTLQSPSILSAPNSPPPPNPSTTAPENQNLSSPSQNQQAPSVASAEYYSAWYKPWVWYSSTIAAQYSEAGLEVGKLYPSLGDGKTQAEIVKEETLVRADTLDNSESNPIPSSVQVNPVLTNVEARTGWLSVLASTTIRARDVKKGGEVMEIMDVDVDESLSADSPQFPVGKKTSVVAKPSEREEKSTPDSSKPSSIRKSTNEEIPVEPLTKVKPVKKQVSRSPTPGKSRDRRPNLVLPTFEDTFTTPPRSIPLPKGPSTLRRTMRYISDIVFPGDERTGIPRKGKEMEVFGQHLPRTWRILGEDPNTGLKHAKRVVVIGIHGWFPGSLMRQVLGEPTGTSTKFANMMGDAVEEYFEQHGCELEKLTKIILEGEGTIEQRVNILLQEYQNRKEWVEDLQNADAILFATHSQGSIVTTHLVDRLISDGHIRTPKTSILDSALSRPAPKVIVLALCGIHNGPLLYLNTSSIVNPYIQYFESAAARELFDFQDSESSVSQAYVKALGSVLHHEIKFTYVASLNDQVVPIYSGAFTSAAHPLILRALYIDGDAYNSSDFLSNLLVLLFKIRNAGLDDGGLITHLSEATAGSLSGVGHSTAYEEPATYTLAVHFLFETSGTLGAHSELNVQPFTARAARNDYEIPWALRDLIAHPDVEKLFSSEFSELRAAFDHWHPRTAVMREIRRKLEPIRRLPTSRL